MIKDFSLSINEPMITGIWGRNGTGKTILMKLLAGHFQPQKGSINIMGLEPYNHSGIKQYLCYMQEEHPFSIIWKVEDVLRYGQYYNPNWDMEYAKIYIKF
ncbi:ATP-binding cassette domain-containing protein [Piscibacillus halophilus]|uniref:ABC-2 type transport system ATP-binding protein n=1 Tax=Piscibacillus halophilus TaxID=571933 RepID=A0A1H9MF47_9BACI|nr:ATP-binding cassette domain-containing protein [Piscibacillus halophilus]SER22087.1 ABC-2 type transport system ATP-binding protein [Piscibacillus halophilus]